MSSNKEHSDVGKMLLGLQDKLNYLQSALSNIDSGYSKQVSLLSTHVEKIQSDVKSKADQLLDKFMNGEVTVQELPGIKIREAQPRKPLSMAGQMQLQSFSKPPREEYKAKREKRRNTTASRQTPIEYVEAPCISEDDISKGMLNLINRGIIPKDVDLTPAFERGAPPLMNRAAPLYPSALKNERVFISSGLPENPHIKYDFNTAETARLEPASAKKPKIQYVEPIIERLPIKESPLPPKAPERILDPREYNELMDTFSSHFFIIRKGATLDTTPEFLSYARTYSFDWDRIRSLIKLMEDLTKRYKLEKVKVDGKMLSDIKVRKVTDEDLMVCIVDYEELLKKIKMPKLLFRTKNGPELAAAKIQAAWKMHKDKQKYKTFLKLSNTAKVIQAAFRRFLQVKTARKSAAIEFKKRMDNWKAMQDKFKQDWPTMKDSKRLEIHLPSLSYDESLRVTMDRFSVRQNLQIARLFNLQDENLSMIYISGFSIPEEIMSYYRRVLELSGIGGIDRRLKVIHPSVQGSILPHMSITKAILCSSDTLRQLKRLVAGQQAYIVPAVMSRDEVELSMILKIPILGGDPYKTALFSTKSGCRRIFSAATIPTPPGAFDIYEEREFMATLTRLIAKNLLYDTWIFKIDNEFNGRGHAWLEVGNMKMIKSLREQKDELSEEQQEALYQYLYKVTHISGPSQQSKACNS